MFREPFNTCGIQHKSRHQKHHAQNQECRTARGIGGKGMHRLNDAGTDHKGAEKTERKGNEREENRKPECPGFLKNKGVQHRRGHKPRNKGRIFNGIPEPPAAPAEFGVGPPAAQSVACGEKRPGHKDKPSEETASCRISRARHQKRRHHGKHNREACVSCKQKRRMHDHPDVLQNGIEVSAFFGNERQKPRKRV